MKKQIELDLQTAKDWFYSKNDKLRQMSLKAYTEEELSITFDKLYRILIEECGISIQTSTHITDLYSYKLTDKAIQAILDYYVFCEEWQYEGAWECILRNMKPSIKFIEEHIKYGYLTYEQVLLSGEYSEFIHYHINEIDWKAILKCDIDFDIIMEFYKYFDVEELIKSQTMWLEEVENYIKLKLNLPTLKNIAQLTDEQWVTFWNIEHNEYVIYYILKYMDYYEWKFNTSIIDEKQNITCKYIREQFSSILMDLKTKFKDEIELVNKMLTWFFIDVEVIKKAISNIFDTDQVEITHHIDESRENFYRVKVKGIVFQLFYATGHLGKYIITIQFLL